MVIFSALPDPHCASEDTGEVKRIKPNILRKLIDTNDYFLRLPLFSFLWLCYFSVLPSWSLFLAPLLLPTTEPLVFPELLFLLLIHVYGLGLHLHAESSHTSDPGSEIISGFPDTQYPLNSIIYYFLNPSSTKASWTKEFLYPFYRWKCWDSDSKGRDSKCPHEMAVWQDQDLGSLPHLQSCGFMAMTWEFHTLRARHRAPVQTQRTTSWDGRPLW